MQQGIGHECDSNPVNTEESTDAFITRLREKATRCAFPNMDDEIMYQVIFGCKSQQLRRYALQKDNLTLLNLAKKGRAYESSQQQASVIEGEGKESKECNKIQRHPGKYSRRYEPPQNKEKQSERITKSCFNCGEKWPHEGGYRKCPARNK